MYSKAGIGVPGGAPAAPAASSPRCEWSRTGNLHVSASRFFPCCASSATSRVTAQPRRGMTLMPSHPGRNAADDDGRVPQPPAMRCPQTSRKGRAASFRCKATLEFEVTSASVAVLSTALSYLALRTYIYFRMEYIIAAMLGRHVPRGGAKVVELNTRGGKNLYYYPSDTVQVVAVSSTSNVQLLENQAARAGVPIQIKTNGPMSLGVPSGSMDAVVSILCFKDVPAKEASGVLQEAARVLKPGKPFIFVEISEPKNPFAQGIRGLSRLVGSKNSPSASDLLPYFQAVDGFEGAEYETLFSFVDPRVVGIARKKLSVVNEPAREQSKGFKKSKRS